MDLQTLWFAAVAVLWTGFLLLEGFDFGVAALLPVLGRRTADRHLMLRTIGPVWDGNEVWLITAAEVWTSLITLTLVYGALAVVELGLITRFVRSGVSDGDSPTPGEPPEGTPESDDVLSFAY